MPHTQVATGRGGSPSFVFCVFLTIRVDLHLTLISSFVLVAAALDLRVRPSVLPAEIFAFGDEGESVHTNHTLFKTECIFYDFQFVVHFDPLYVLLVQISVFMTTCR